FRTYPRAHVLNRGADTVSVPTIHRPLGAPTPPGDPTTPSGPSVSILRHPVGPVSPNQPRRGRRSSIIPPFPLETRRPRRVPLRIHPPGPPTPSSPRGFS